MPRSGRVVYNETKNQPQKLHLHSHLHSQQHSKRGALQFRTLPYLAAVPCPLPQMAGLLNCSKLALTSQLQTGRAAYCPPYLQSGG
eukprot:366270-Chlamydomonas_euryale.AAC.4